MVFAESTYSNLTNITQIFDVAQTFTDGLIGFGLWLLITFGSFFLMSSFNTKESLISAAFISLISGLLLAYIGLLDGVYVIASVVLYIIGIITLIFSKQLGGA